ncbi:MAG TPA: hypothetical protein PLM71_08655 [Syntrophorhabdaceae bacterium]|nr:hypothetical protein [Syntrophorhabdaceae bacterium]
MHPAIIKNTLLSRASIEKILSMPYLSHIYGSLEELFRNFEEKKRFASEIHTEIHLVKPVLKLLGFSYESKPKFFEDHVKSPDIALFEKDEARLDASKVWGTEEYYRRTIATVFIKRYGRTLEKGISGFYLEFENRIPIFQALYIMKKTKTPWGILTNGRNWILIKRPLDFEETVIEIDLEYPHASPEQSPFHPFFYLFSPESLLKTIPELLEEERKDMAYHLKIKRETLIKGIKGKEKKVDIYPVIYDTYREIFEDGCLPETEAYLKEKNIRLNLKSTVKTDIFNPYITPQIFTYVFSMNGKQSGIDIQTILDKYFTGKIYTKETLLNLKILEMTPNFGSVISSIIEGIAYKSFIVPYNEKNTFVAEWEDEKALKKYILDNMLYGVERSHIVYDMLKDAILKRFGFDLKNFKLGNPLIGMSLKDIANHIDIKNQMGLFTKNPQEIISELRTMFKQYYNLSDRIKEDLEEKRILELKIKKYSERIKDAMDAITASYFISGIERKKIQGLLLNLDEDELYWETIRKTDWFIEAKQVAKKNGFFHFEIELPFLMNDAFDIIFIQPGLIYLWENELPVMEITKAYIKRGASYLKGDGMFVIIAKGFEDKLIEELNSSKKYTAKRIDDIILLCKRQADFKIIQS